MPQGQGLHSRVANVGDKHNPKSVEWLRIIASGAPGLSGFAVTPSDTVSHVLPARAYWVGVLGDVSVLSADGLTTVYKGAQGLLPVAGVRINSTGTTATNIIGLPYLA